MAQKGELYITPASFTTLPIRVAQVVGITTAGVLSGTRCSSSLSYLSTDLLRDVALTNSYRRLFYPVLFYHPPALTFSTGVTGSPMAYDLRTQPIDGAYGGDHEFMLRFSRLRLPQHVLGTGC